MKPIKKFMLSEQEMPTQWYNIVADMPNKPLPPLHPRTKQPLKPEDLYSLFAQELAKQEFTTERYIEIPDEVQDLYKIWRSTPLVRAYALEKALDTPAKIYFKNEGTSPAGSHKPNTAIAQAYYNYKQGVKRITTETGGGQWGTALSFACQHFGLDLKVFMVKVSYNQKPYRKLMMNTWGADVIPSPSNLTEAGRKILREHPDSAGSLGIAISEAVELAAQDPMTNYSLGSVLNHVLLHQTIIGEEALLQMEKAGDEPDIVIGCFGGGSNFAGISFPFIHRNLKEGKHTRGTAILPEVNPRSIPIRFRRYRRVDPLTSHVHAGTRLPTCEHSCRRITLPWSRGHRQPTPQGQIDGSRRHSAIRDLRGWDLICQNRRNNSRSRVHPRHSASDSGSENRQSRRKSQNDSVQPIRTRHDRPLRLRTVPWGKPPKLRAFRSRNSSISR